MFKKGVMVFLFIILLASPVVYACEADSDCNDGAICMQTSFDYYGYCYGGVPSTDYVNPPMDKTAGDAGDLCLDDSGCGLEGQCIVPRGETYGYCY